MKLSKVTIWNKWNPKSETYEHNHIQSGHIVGEYPLPLGKNFKGQKSWKSNKWQKEFGFLLKGYKLIIQGESMTESCIGDCNSGLPWQSCGSNGQYIGVDLAKEPDRTAYLALKTFGSFRKVNKKGEHNE